MSSKIAFIGSAGVPNNYGGFEMFLESCAPELAKRFRNVIITCDASRYEDKSKMWNAVERVFISISANGASSVLHDFLAFFSVFFRVDSIVVLGVSGGIFFPFFRLLCSIFCKQLVVNVDGVEWRRAKFSKYRRAFLFISDRLAQWSAHKVIVDNEALRPYLIPSARQNAVLIAYPGDHVHRVEKVDDASAKYPKCLTICRIEPENNCDLLIEAFASAKRGSYVFVGNWDASEYGRDLRKKYKDVEGLELRDPVYDKHILADLRENCDIYLHGHSVGGTNPSLVEMLFYDCKIVAFDCTFNRATAGGAIGFFTDASDLARAIHIFEKHVREERADVRHKYSKIRICDAYTRELLRENPKAQAAGALRSAHRESGSALSAQDEELVEIDASQS